MTTATTSLLSLNRGIMSRLGVARVDLKRTGLAAEQQTNWMPRVLGSMSLRPGFEYLGTTYNNAVARNIPFVYAADDCARIELTDSLMRVWVDDALVSRTSVSTAIANGTFDTDLASWTDADESGATSEWVAGGYMSLAGTNNNYAIRRQEVTVAAADRSKEHALRIVVARGPVMFRCGSTAGGDEYLNERTLRTGTHSLTFTPTGNFHLQFSNLYKNAVLVDSVAVESSGTFTLPIPWAASELPKLRYTQSADVLFVACAGKQQYRIERWSTTGWSIVKYEPTDGPFRLINTSPITLTPSAIDGEITLTASKPLFKSTHVGALFRHTSSGQYVEADVSGPDQWTDPILVNGVGGERRFAVLVEGTWSGTVRLQYSVAEPGSWVDVQSYTQNVSFSNSDDLDGQIIYYRIGIKGGEYTSGTAEVSLYISSGSSTGTMRITGVTNSTTASATVVDTLGGATASTDWWEGAWSDFRGWPSAVGLYEGRLWWVGKSNIWGSVSDAYESFDDEIEGDSGPIDRTIGEGPVDVINWLLPMQQMVIGTDSAELVVRSSALDEPLTPTAFTIKPVTTQGSKKIAAARVDEMGFFVQRSGQKVYMLSTGEGASLGSEDVTQLVPDLNEGGINFIAVQRQPDTRLHCVRADGKVSVMVFDKVETVMGWCLVETDGVVEDICVLPGEGEDAVYYIVRRTINGATVRYHEKWAKESECRGGTVNKQADAFYYYDDGILTATITGLSHLEGKEVVVWGAGKDLGTYTVSGGQITLSEAVSSAIVGLGYTADYQSMKQGLSEALALPLNQTKRISEVGLVLADTHYQGLEFGQDFDTLEPLPLMEDETVTPDDTVWEAYDKGFLDFVGDWTTDARICLRARAPRPCTVLAVQAVVTTNG
jgi:hypothetical protein